MTRLIVIHNNDGTLAVKDSIASVSLREDIKYIRFLGDYTFEEVLAFAKDNKVEYEKVIYNNTTLSVFLERSFYKIKRKSCTDI